MSSALPFHYVVVAPRPGVQFKGNPNLPPEEQAVTAEPQLKEMPVTDHGDFMVRGDDGINLHTLLHANQW
jgi:hypothetical protein